MRVPSFVGTGKTESAYPLEVQGLPYLHDMEGEGERVTVEVYDVTPQTFQRLDLLEGQPDFLQTQSHSHIHARLEQDLRLGLLHPEPRAGLRDGALGHLQGARDRQNPRA